MHIFYSGKLNSELQCVVSGFLRTEVPFSQIRALIQVEKGDLFFLATKNKLKI
jgi:hypothetical protein